MDVDAEESETVPSMRNDLSHEAEINQKLAEPLKEESFAEPEGSSWKWKEGLRNTVRAAQVRRACDC